MILVKVSKIISINEAAYVFGMKLNRKRSKFALESEKMEFMNDGS